MQRAMRVAPQLDPALKPGPVRQGYALLINPFYPKDPHAFSISNLLSVVRKILKRL